MTRINSLWDDKKNERRCNLVDKGIEGTLLPLEKRELEELQRWMSEYLRAEEVQELQTDE